MAKMLSTTFVTLYLLFRCQKADMCVSTDRCFWQYLVIPTSNDFLNAAGVRNQSNRAHCNTFRLRYDLRKTALSCNICNQTSAYAGCGLVASTYKSTNVSYIIFIPWQLSLSEYYLARIAENVKIYFSHAIVYYFASFNLTCLSARTFVFVKNSSYVHATIFYMLLVYAIKAAVRMTTHWDYGMACAKPHCRVTYAIKLQLMQDVAWLLQRINRQTCHT